ncbi:MAG TPA: hypothetical protein VLR92_10660, partial [Blastocatellia bacterium]|nr:hypothetical protein [Blastocatellia bacterium]
VRNARFDIAVDRSRALFGDAIWLPSASPRALGTQPAIQPARKLDGSPRSGRQAPRGVCEPLEAVFETL